MLEDFYNETGISVEVIYVASTGGWGGFFSKIQTMIAGGDAPDVIRIAIEGFELFLDNGIIVPLNEYEEKYDIYTPEGEAMLDYFMETLEIPEEDYCVPLIVYGDEWFAGRKSIYLSLASRIQEDPDRQTTILEEIQED